MDIRDPLGLELELQSGLKGLVGRINLHGLAPCKLKRVSNASSQGYQHLHTTEALSLVVATGCGSRCHSNDPSPGQIRQTGGQTQGTILRTVLLELE